MRTAFKTNRWFADTYQKWMDIEAKLVGNGKLRQAKPTLKITNIKPSLKSRIEKWVPHQVLMDDLVWEEWTYEWEGDNRPYTNDRNIWNDICARMLTLVLPIVPHSGELRKLKFPFWNVENRGRVWVVDVQLDQGPEIFTLSNGQKFNLSQMAQVTLAGYRIGFQINPHNEQFFTRCRRQYFPQMGSMSSFDHYNWRGHFSVATSSPNSTSTEWKVVLEARKQRAFSALLGRKLI